MAGPPHTSAATEAERERLGALAAFDVLDTPAESEFDNLAHLAAELCGTPVALVSFVDSERQWFKARVGFAPCETDLQSSVCRFVLHEPDVLVIPDLTRDPRTAANPLVIGDPHIRFYAGAPLRTSQGHVLGSLCVIDATPRPEGLTERQADNLRRLAAQVVGQLEMRRMIRERDAAAEALAASGSRRAALAELADHLRSAHTAEAMSYTAAAIVGRALGAVRAGFGLVDPRRETVDIAPDWRAEGVASIAGEHSFRTFGSYVDDLLRGETVIVTDVRTDPRTFGAGARALERIGVRALVNSPVVERGELAAVSFAHFAEPRSLSGEEQAFIRAAADRTQVGVARLRAEQRQAVLNGEISHRLKNILAMVQGLASQTLRGQASAASLAAFNDRLAALSKAQDVLMQSEWQAADLRTLVSEALGLVGALDRCTVDGPPVSFGSRSALSTSLLMHELATNARKYGALSRPEGRVSVAWRLDDADELTLTWREAGGPPVALPTTQGFGSRLLRLGLAGTGGSDLAYGSDGFSASFRAPLRQVEEA